jgi:simple sugar transport system ATP-binding protein
MLVETLTVTENIILGIEPGRGGVIDYKDARKQVAAISDKYGLEVDPDANIESISVGLQQRVEILKALYREAKILILDEPTAVLTPQEVDELFEVIEALRDSGVSIIIITHKLEEIKEITERVYILRRGKMAGERKTEDVTKADLANLMVGRDVVLTVHKEEKTIDTEPVFQIEDLYVKNEKGIDTVAGLSLSVRPGEVVGIAGVDGNGQSDLAQAIRGLQEIASGKISFKGQNIARDLTKERIHKKMGYVPADRQRFGLVLPMKISENTVMGFHDREPFVKGINLNLKVIKSYSEDLVEQFDIRTPSVGIPAGTLSGGNQQKVILAREFARDPEFLLVSQPTRGLDVGAIEYIHSQVLKMRGKGVAILLISLELEEIFSLSDRILVLYEGKIVKEFIPEQTDEKEVGLYMTGGEAKEKAV